MAIILHAEIFVPNTEGFGQKMEAGGGGKKYCCTRPPISSPFLSSLKRVPYRQLAFADQSVHIL